MSKYTHQLTRAIGLLAALALTGAACTASEQSSTSQSSVSQRGADLSGADQSGADQSGGRTIAAGLVELDRSADTPTEPGETGGDNAKTQGSESIVDESGGAIDVPTLPAGIDLEGAVEQIDLDDGSIMTIGDVAVTTDAGVITLPDARVIESPDGAVATVATIPLPDSGPLATAIPSALPNGKVGTATGAQLSATVPHLSPDTIYTYLLFRGELSLDTGIAGGSSDLLDHIEVFGQEPGIVVIDPDDYFYVGGTCVTGGTADKERNDSSPGPAGSKPGESAISDFDPVVIALEPADVAVPCGFGISNGGRIPVEPDLVPAAGPIPEMNAHVLIHGSEVVAPGLALDGTMFFQLLDPGFRMVANGTLLASLSVISGTLGIDVPLGDATIDMSVSSNGLQTRFVTESADPGELLLPVVVDVAGVDGGVRAEGSFGFAIAADGTPSVAADSYLHIEGRLNLQAGGLAGVAGVELSAISIDGLMHLDPTGYRVAGSFDGSLVPQIDLGAGATVEAFIAFDDLANSSILVAGDASVGVIELTGEAGLRVDRNGVEAWGTAAFPFGAIEVRGAITAEGISLSGSARAAVPLGPIADAAGALRGELQTAKDEVANLDGEIERIRADINTGRDANQAGLRRAQADVAAERAGLDAILDTMAHNRGEIRRMQAEQKASWDPFYDLDLSIRIGALEVANLAQDGYRLVAQAALDIAVGVLQVIESGLEVIPVDADPRIVALFIAREAAMLVLDGATAVLSIVPDEVRANLDIVVGTAGFVGEAGIETCVDGDCTMVVAGSVQSSPAQLCFTLLEQDLCVGLPDLVLM